MSNIKYLTKEILFDKVKRLNSPYWNISYNKRWDYMSIAVDELKKIKPKSVLELGAYKINLTSLSDNMDKRIDNIDIDNIKNMNYIQDSTDVPWNIPDKYYDVFVALQVFEHLKGKQAEVFSEVMRTSKWAILSFPFLWEDPKDVTHYNITTEKIKGWTKNMKPENVIYSSNKKRRVIYVFNNSNYD